MGTAENPQEPASTGRPSVRLIGFWAPADGEESELPDPTDFVDAEYDEDERWWVADYLERGQVALSFTGVSRCRLCSCPNGSRDLTDGTYVWPEGLGHYVLVHGVRLPAEFITHIEDRLAALEALERDRSWWLENAERA